MKNYVQPGETITVTAPYAVSSGGGVLVGNIFGVATNDAANGASVEIITEGVVDIVKASGAVTQGQLIFWDNSAKVVTTVNGGGNMPIGVATQAQNSGDATARVLLSEGLRALGPSKFLFGTATLDFPSTGAAGTQDLTITVTGAAVGDMVICSLPAAINAGLVFNAFVSAADTVKIRCQNLTAGALDPASATFNVVVLKF
jgi:predicted RecA/RadA family phage recombinase